MFQKMVKYFLLLLLIQPVYALNSDKDQVMHVMADSADLRQNEHQGIYKGNVSLSQGTSNLHAAQAITKANKKNQLERATATGNAQQQAHYWTITDPTKPPLHAYADTIHYYPLLHRIELIGNARVEQGTDSFSAPKISYDTVKQRVLSEGNQKQRIVIIYHPEKKSL